MSDSKELVYAQDYGCEAPFLGYRATKHMLRKAGAQRMDNRGAAGSVLIRFRSQITSTGCVACMSLVALLPTSQHRLRDD